MKYGRYFRAAAVGLVSSAVVYAAAFWMYPMENGEASAWQDAMLWAGAVGFVLSALALVAGVLAYAVRGPVA